MVNKKWRNAKVHFLDKSRNFLNIDFSKPSNEAYVLLCDYILGRIDNMDFSRYPFGMSFNDHFYVGARGNVHVDLENFAERFTVVAIQLKKLFEFLCYHDLKNEELH
jgi:hypothetical protein